MNIWDLCEGNHHVQALSLEPWRVVENQHVLSSRDLVDSVEEHHLLEDLIEESKPFIEKKTNYLLFTPFRYPPLKYGSRFGSVYEPSLWYGALDLETAFIEVAYYRLRFFADSAADLGSIEISMTAFTAILACTRGIDLTELPFNQYTTALTHKTEYAQSQLLGTSMRKAQIEAFVYFSARTEKPSKNIAAFTPAVFQAKKQYLSNQQTWKCFATKKSIEFTRIGILSKQRFAFSEAFFVN